MADAFDRPSTGELTVSWRTIVRVIATVVVACLLWRLSSLITLGAIAVVLALTLNPVVVWLEERRCPRWGAATGIVVLLVGAVAAFGYVTSTELSEQSRLLGGRLQQATRSLLDGTPQSWLNVLAPQDAAASIEAYLGGAALRLVRSAARAAGMLTLAVI